MKKIIIFIALLLPIGGAGWGFAQTLSPKATPTSGGYSTGGTTTLSWTMGETYNTTLSVGTTMLTQGEQQPYVTGCTTPPTPGSISGPISLCNMSTATYSIASVAGAVSYTWTVPSYITSAGVFSGMTITSGQGSTSITVSFTGGGFTPAGPGNITVKATNTCGNSTPRSLTVAKKPGTPGAITASSLCGTTTATYSIAPTSNTVDYVWTVPTGLTITSPVTQTVYGVPHYGPSITVSKSPSFIVGNIEVSSWNACGNYQSPPITVYGNVPATPNPISGLSSVCAPSSGTYTIIGSTGATAYTWSVTGNATVSGAANLSKTVNFGSTFTTGNLSVYASNVCGNSYVRTKPLTGTICAPASPISVDNTVIEETKTTLFNLYPNPTTGTFIIENGQLTIDNRQFTIEVYDVLGNKVMQTLMYNNQLSLNINQYKSGMYFVRVIDSNSNTIYSQRVIKE